MDSKACSGQLVFIDESILMHMHVKLGKNSPFVSGIFGPKIHERNTMMLSLYVLLHMGELRFIPSPVHSPNLKTTGSFAFGSKFSRGQQSVDMYGQNYIHTSLLSFSLIEHFGVK